VTRAALREAVYACCSSLSRAEASKMLDAVFEEICETLARGEPVKLRAFGSFNVRSKRGRVGRNPKRRNPKTGAEAEITPRKVLTFKASPVLVARVNGETIAAGFGAIHQPFEVRHVTGHRGDCRATEKNVCLA
jgi:integration host factor subunit alpha